MKTDVGIFEHSLAPTGHQVVVQQIRSEIQLFSGEGFARISTSMSQGMASCPKERARSAKESLCWRLVNVRMSSRVGQAELVVWTSTRQAVSALIGKCLCRDPPHALGAALQHPVQASMVSCAVPEADVPSGNAAPVEIEGDHEFSWKGTLSRPSNLLCQRYGDALGLLWRSTVKGKQLQRLTAHSQHTSRWWRTLNIRQSRLRAKKLPEAS